MLPTKVRSATDSLVEAGLCDRAHCACERIWRRGCGWIGEECEPSDQADVAMRKLLPPPANTRGSRPLSISGVGPCAVMQAGAPSATSRSWLVPVLVISVFWPTGCSVVTAGSSAMARARQSRHRHPSSQSGPILKGSFFGKIPLYLFGNYQRLSLIHI